MTRCCWARPTARPTYFLTLLCTAFQTRDQNTHRSDQNTCLLLRITTHRGDHQGARPFGIPRFLDDIHDDSRWRPSRSSSTAPSSTRDTIRENQMTPSICGNERYSRSRLAFLLSWIRFQTVLTCTSTAGRAQTSDPRHEENLAMQTVNAWDATEARCTEPSYNRAEYNTDRISS